MVDHGDSAGGDASAPLVFSGEGLHGGDVWGAARALGVPVTQILDLSASLNPLGPPPGLHQELAANFDRLCHYPDRQALELRRALAAHHGLGLGNVLPGNGSTALIRLIARVMDLSTIVVMAPAFGEIPRSLALTSRHFHYLLMDEKNNYAGREGDLERLWDMEPNCVFLTNPVSPSGVCWDLEVIDQLIAQAKRRRCWVVLDEAFIDFASDEQASWSPGRVLGYNRLLVLRSMTKIYCMAGLRLGYLLAHEEALRTFNSLGEPWSVNTLAQAAGVYCLGRREFVEQTRKQGALWREAMAERMAALGLKVYPSEVNYLLARIPPEGPTAAQVARACAPHGVLVRNCESFVGCGDHHLRVAVCQPADQDRLFEALAPTL